MTYRSFLPPFHSACLFVPMLLLAPTSSRAVRGDDAAIRVELDVSEVPHLKEWGEQARVLLLEWHPRIDNLLPTKGVRPPRAMVLRIRRTNEGVGSTSGTTITISSGWIEKHPDDLGLVVHELVHVVQSYRSYEPLWLTEGIADYLRWGIYEGKEQAWFPRPQDQQGYRQGYRVTGGFLLWLEAEHAPGLVKKLNTAMRRGEYSDELFRTETGKSLDELWTTYVAPQG